MARRTHTGDCVQLQLWPFLPTCLIHGDTRGSVWSNWRRSGEWAPLDILWSAVGDRDAGVVSFNYPTEQGSGTTTASYGWVEAPTCFGGLRYGWLCPECGRVTRTLFRPPNAPHFACRSCHGLLYESQYRTPKQRRKAHRLDRYRELLFRPFSGHHEAELFALMDWKKAEEAREQLKRARAAQPKRSPGRPREKRPYQRRAPVTLSPRTSETQAYCPRCRDRREMVKAVPGRFSNGRPVMRGRCSECGCPMARLIKAVKHG